MDLSTFDFRTGKMLMSKVNKNRQRMRYDCSSQAKVRMVSSALSCRGMPRIGQLSMVCVCIIYIYFKVLTILGQLCSLLALFSLLFIFWKLSIFSLTIPMGSWASQITITLTVAVCYKSDLLSAFPQHLSYHSVESALSITRLHRIRCAQVMRTCKVDTHS